MLAASLAAPVLAKAPVAQTTYPTADAAAAALMEALKSDDPDALRAVLGPGSEPLIDSRDRTADAAQRGQFVAAYDEKHVLVPQRPTE